MILPESKTTSPGKGRKKSPLPVPLDHALRSYAVAAGAITSLNRNHELLAIAIGAIGFGCLGVPSLANAEIVYTPANQNFHGNATLRIDLDNDGNPDVMLRASSSVDFSSGFKFNGGMSARGLHGNRIQIFHRGLAAALQLGERIVPGLFEANAEMAACHSGFTTTTQFSFRTGSWRNVTNRYLSVKFVIADEVHYGWARLTVNGCGTAATLTGYAYETVPNRHIPAGILETPASLDMPDPGEKTTEADASPAFVPATLGMLARGADELTTWRKRQ